MNTSNPLVQKQYTAWAYPQPIDDIERWQAQGGYQPGDPSLDHDIIWPERAYNPDISILVAGCGTIEAAIEAYNNPRASVVGIDLSPTSLEYATRLKNKHDLANLELLQMDLHNVASLNRKFDLVISFGVLHALPYPQTGLMSLAEVVKDHGVIHLMLYGKYMRSGIYMVQEALRLMDISQTPEDVAFTRSVIDALPAHHAARAYMKNAPDLVHDTGIVDTFLHRQDRAYTVPEILELVDKCNLNFQGWLDNLDYYPDGTLSPDHPLYQKLATLPQREQWAVYELLSQSIGCHRFLLRKRNGDVNKYKIDFDYPTCLKMVPSYRHFLKIEEGRNGTIQLSREWHRLQIEGLEKKLFLSTDGTTTIGEIISKQASTSPGDEERARLFFRRMWRLGHFTMANYTDRS